jgi:biotin carboxyl carrier protein
MATEMKAIPQRDLRALSRGGDHGGDEAASSPASARIPRPPINWKTRVLLPATILVVGLGLLWYALGDALSPAVEVRVVPVVVKTTVESGGAVTVQAPGWVEAAPYPISVPALADGTVKDVVVLEGQPVKVGDVVARLVDDDARLALARAEARLKQHEAALRAAQQQWDHPVERTRAVAAGEAMVAETRAQIEQLGAEVAPATGWRATSGRWLRTPRRRRRSCRRSSNSPPRRARSARSRRSGPSSKPSSASATPSSWQRGRT